MIAINRKIRLFIGVVGIIVLFLVPQWIDIYAETSYYFIIIIFSIFCFTKFYFESYFNERFYLRWSEKRKSGSMKNIIKGTFHSMFYLLLLLFFGQFIINGHTLQDFSQVSLGANVFIIALILIFSIIPGVIRWFANEERYLNRQKKLNSE